MFTEPLTPAPEQFADHRRKGLALATIPAITSAGSFLFTSYTLEFPLCDLASLSTANQRSESERKGGDGVTSAIEEGGQLRPGH